MADQDEPYWLARSATETARLDKQHSLYTQNLGYLLHPSIKSRLPAEHAHILDIGTGTGIWLRDLAKEVPPSYHLDGFDISSAQFPPQASLPSNIHLFLNDFKKPIPSDLTAKYDVIHCRLLIISLGEGAWEPTLRNILKLLKPGGAIQWVESDFLRSRGVRGGIAASSSLTTTHHLTLGQTQLNSTLYTRFKFSFPDFDALFREVGLKGVEVDVVSNDRVVELREQITGIAIGAVFGGLRNLARLGEEGGDVWGVERVEEVREGAIGEMKGGSYMRWDVHVGVGWKG